MTNKPVKGGGRASLSFQLPEKWEPTENQVIGGLLMVIGLLFFNSARASQQSR